MLRRSAGSAARIASSRVAISRDGRWLADKHIKHGYGARREPRSCGISVQEPVCRLRFEVRHPRVQHVEHRHRGGVPCFQEPFWRSSVHFSLCGRGGLLFSAGGRRSGDTDRGADRAAASPPAALGAIWRPVGFGAAPCPTVAVLCGHALCMRPPVPVSMLMTVSGPGEVQMLASCVLVGSDMPLQLHLVKSRSSEYVSSVRAGC